MMGKFEIAYGVASFECKDFTIVVFMGTGHLEVRWNNGLMANQEVMAMVDAALIDRMKNGATKVQITEQGLDEMARIINGVLASARELGLLAAREAG